MRLRSFANYQKDVFVFLQVFERKKHINYISKRKTEILSILL